MSTDPLTNVPACPECGRLVMPGAEQVLANGHTYHAECTRPPLMVQALTLRPGDRLVVRVPYTPSKVQRHAISSYVHATLGVRPAVMGRDVDLAVVSGGGAN